MHLRFNPPLLLAPAFPHTSYETLANSLIFPSLIFLFFIMEFCENYRWWKLLVLSYFIYSSCSINVVIFVNHDDVGQMLLSQKCRYPSGIHSHRDLLVLMWNLWNNTSDFEYPFCKKVTKAAGCWESKKKIILATIWNNWINK